MKPILNCKTKGRLKLAGEAGTKSDYEAMTEAASRASREAALAKLVARYGEGDACRGTAITDATLKKGAPLLVDATLEDESLSLRFDALKRVDGPLEGRGPPLRPRPAQPRRQGRPAAEALAGRVRTGP